MTTFTLSRVSTSVATMADASIRLIGKTATDRKFEALNSADSVGVVAISHGRGKVAVAARDIKRADETLAVAKSIAMGNLHAFAVKVGAALGESVKFVKITNEDGTVRRSASQAFRDYGAVIESKMLQLEVKGKDFTPKGSPTSAYAELMDLQGLHDTAVQLMDMRDEEDAKRRAAQAALEDATIQGEGGYTDDVANALEAGVTVQ